MFNITPRWFQTITVLGEATYLSLTFKYLPGIWMAPIAALIVVRKFFNQLK